MRSSHSRVRERTSPKNESSKRIRLSALHHGLELEGVIVDLLDSREQCLGGGPFINSPTQFVSEVDRASVLQLASVGEVDAGGV